MTTPTITADELAKMLERIPPKWNPHELVYDPHDHPCPVFVSRGWIYPASAAASMLLGGIVEKLAEEGHLPTFIARLASGLVVINLYLDRELNNGASKKGPTYLHAAVAAVEAISKESKRD